MCTDWFDPWHGGNRTWGSRPLKELIDHLRFDRYHLVNHRLADIGRKLQELWFRDHGRRQAAFNGLSEAFDRLRDRVRCCSTLDHDVVYPVVAQLHTAARELEAAERDDVRLDAGDAYDRVVAARAERQHLFTAICDTQRAIETLVTPDVAIEVALLCADIDTLLLLLLDQLDLEERHVWPRLIQHLES